MDPNANLEELLGIANKIVTRGDNEEVDLELSTLDADRMAELVLALDNWIRRGGFIPTAWSGK